jgi:hypothetical protein
MSHITGFHDLVIPAKAGIQGQAARRPGSPLLSHPLTL